MSNTQKIGAIILSLGLLVSLVSFKPKEKKKNLWEILEAAFREKANVSKKSGFDKTVQDVRKKAFEKFNIPLDTANIVSCIVINQISLGAMSNVDGKIIINDSIIYNYYEDVLTREIVVINDSRIFSDSLVVSLLQKHQFINLEKLAEENGQDITGDYVYYIACYDKNWDSTYVRMLPAFIKYDSNYR